MNIEKVVVDKKNNIVQITSQDERWYEKDGVYAPSVTWVCGKYPRGIGFYRWLADKGWDEAEAIKEDAGAAGSKVHQAIERLVYGNEVSMSTPFVNTKTSQEEPLSVNEWQAVVSFRDWFEEVKPTILKSEFVVWSENPLYAGTVDLLVETGGEKWLVDIKTSQNVWPSHELQVSAYNQIVKADTVAILQVGYARNKKGYKLTEVEDKFDLFMSTYNIWEHEHGGEQPKQIELPLSVKLEGGVITQ